MSEQNDDQWSKKLIKELATDALKERRRSRRWGIFFKTLTFAYLIGLLYVAMPDTFDFDDDALAKKDHVALVDLEGEISTEEGENAEGVVKGLRAAYKDDHTKAIIIRINSPGGLPVQASYIQKEIKRLKAKHPDFTAFRARPKGLPGKGCKACNHGNVSGYILGIKGFLALYDSPDV